MDYVNIVIACIQYIFLGIAQTSQLFENLCEVNFQNLVCTSYVKLQCLFKLYNFLYVAKL